MNQLSIYSGPGALQSQRSLARRLDSELQLVEARAEIAHSQAQAGATLSAATINNIGALTSLSEQVVKASPAAAPYVEMVVRGYATSAAMQITAFMR